MRKYTLQLEFQTAQPLRWTQMREAVERTVESFAGMATGTYHARLIADGLYGRSCEERGFYDMALPDEEVVR